ncbi:MAG: quinone-dependent dihydroorotate dehydrogenase [Leptospiraceae bacterium]
MHPAFFYGLLKPVLFSLDPEKAHELVTGPARTLMGLPGGAAYLKATLGYESDALGVQCAGIHFPGPVGMAAGFDKTGQLYPFLASAGFHFVESGTFTPRPQEGNPRPRLFRFPEQGVLINRMGFNNPGMDQASSAFADQDAKRKKSGKNRSCPRGVNIGKNKVTPNDEAIQDYIKAFRSLEPYADYITINISSPNTPGLRDLQSAAFLGELLSELSGIAKEIDSTTPIFVKLAPDIDDRDLPALIETSLNGSAAGLILSNTTITRDFVGASEKMKSTEGGLSGCPLFARSTDLLRRTREIIGSSASLIGVGGIDSPKTALAKILAGADLIQIYTGYIFQGPVLPARISRFLDRVCRTEGCTVPDLTGKEKEFSHWLKEAS